MFMCNFTKLITPELDGCFQYIELLGDDYSNCNSTLAYLQKSQQTLGAPMLWIGIYVAAASLICLLAMAADTYQGFRKRAFWFPCKFFTLNAASLTLLAVAMKLPLDLSNPMEGGTDQLAKLNSNVFMCIIMGNFMPSLGAMNDKEIIMNIAALVIFVITVLVNVGIQLGTGAIMKFFLLEIVHVIVMISMFMLLVILSVTASSVPTFREILELKYSEIHKVASNEELEQDNGMITVEKLKEKVAKYWMMAKTGSPQFVITRSATCFASGAICLLVGLALVGLDMYEGFWLFGFSSDYKWSTVLIGWIQLIAVVVGTVASTSRWFNATISMCSKKGRNLSRDQLKVENYWIQRLLEWKESPLALQFRNRKLRKLSQTTKSIILDCCIIVQNFTVAASKVIQRTSVFFVSSVLSFWYCWKKLNRKFRSEMIFQEESRRTDQARAGTNLDLSRYVLKLEGEEELPENTLNNISDSLNHLIQMAKKQQPKKMLELLKISKGFKGVAQFNSNQVPSLLPEEPPICWSLAVVTLTTIAISLPNISSDLADRLLSSVSEGFSYVRLIEKCLDTKGKFVNIGKAAEVVWLKVELYRRWLDKDLREMSPKEKTSKENLVLLTGIATKIIMEFKGNLSEGQKMDVVDLPVMVIAASSMHKISQTLLLSCQDELTDERLFEQLSVMIADVLAACLTNLPRVITMKCYCSSIVKREKSVKIAVRLLGETEEILEILQQLQLPNLNADQLAVLDEWRVILSQPYPTGNNSSFGNETDSCGSSEVHIAIEEV